MKTNHRRGFKANDRDRSRKKGSRGKEFWTRRPGNEHGQTVGKFSKKRTHKRERRDGKTTVGSLLKLIGDMPNERTKS